MPTHLTPEPEDTIAIPTDCILKVLKRSKFMGTFKAVYDYAQRKARLELKEAMNTYVWLETLPENENLIIINASNLARTLGLSKATIHNHLNRILEAGLMEPDEREAFKIIGISAYRLCPFCSWRGTGDAMGKYISKLPSNHRFFKYMDPEFMTQLVKEAAIVEQSYE